MTRILVAIFFIIFLAIVYVVKITPKEEKIIPHVTNDSICMEDSFSVKDFVFELHLQGIKYPDVVLKQACLESNFFTSKVWKEKNNPFGFYHSIDSIHGEYILFNDWRSALEYYKSWQDKKYKGGNYYEFLSKINYASDTTYVECVKNIDLRNLKVK